MNTQVYSLEENLLERATNFYGKLDKESKNQIVSYIKEPSEHQWDKIHSWIINGDEWVTLWRAVCMVTPDFPIQAEPKEKGGYKWERIPSAQDIIRALAHSVPNNQERMKRVK